jgi:uncharacterized CHY-type Zn-finger protein
MGLYEAYKILGVEPGSQPDAVKHAYRGLVWIWHPDHLRQNPRLLEIAGERIKLYNQAYELITKSLRPKDEPHSHQHKHSWDGSGIFTIRVACPVCKNYLDVSPYASRLVCAECNTPLLVKEPVQRMMPFQSKVSPWGDCLSTMQQTEPWPALNGGSGPPALSGDSRKRSFHGLAHSIHLAMQGKGKYGNTSNLVGQIGAIVL